MRVLALLLLTGCTYVTESRPETIVEPTPDAAGADAWREMHADAGSMGDAGAIPESSTPDVTTPDASPDAPPSCTSTCYRTVASPQCGFAEVNDAGHTIFYAVGYLCPVGCETAPAAQCWYPQTQEAGVWWCCSL